MTRPRTRRALGTALTGRVAFTPRRNFSGGRVGEMRGVCSVGGSGSGVDRAWLQAPTHRASSTGLTPCRSIQEASIELDPSRNRLTRLFAYPRRNLDGLISPLTCPPVAFTGLHVSWTQRAARVSKRPHRPMPFGAHVGHVHHAVCVLVGPLTRLRSAGILRPCGQ